MLPLFISLLAAPAIDAGKITEAGTALQACKTVPASQQKQSTCNGHWGAINFERYSDYSGNAQVEGSDSRWSFACGADSIERRTLCSMTYVVSMYAKNGEVGRISWNGPVARVGETLFRKPDDGSFMGEQVDVFLNAMKSSKIGSFRRQSYYPRGAYEDRTVDLTGFTNILMLFKAWSREFEAKQEWSR